MSWDEFDGDAGGCVVVEVGTQLFQDDLWILVRHETEGEFHEGFCGQDGFRSLALVATADAVQLHGGACPGAFGGAVAGLAEERWGAGYC